MTGFWPQRPGDLRDGPGRLAASRRGWAIINIGSVMADQIPLCGTSVYSLSKAAVAGLTSGLARQLGPRGITVNTVQPGPVDTDMNPDSGEFADAMRSLTAVGCYGQPHDIAGAVAFLARAEARFVTGTAWNVDGAYALRASTPPDFAGLWLGDHDRQLAPIDLGASNSSRADPCALAALPTTRA
jgi:short-subunit dehydrogenase